MKPWHFHYADPTKLVATRDAFSDVHNVLHTDCWSHVHVQIRTLHTNVALGPRHALYMLLVELAP